MCRVPDHGPWIPGFERLQRLDSSRRLQRPTQE